MLTLILKGKWYDMIASGEKTEEYREIKPYYTKRFQNVGLLHRNGKPSACSYANIIFRRGYAKDAPRVRCLCWLRIGEGRERWGAVSDKKYYVLTITMRKELMPGDLPQRE